MELLKQSYYSLPQEAGVTPPPNSTKPALVHFVLQCKPHVALQVTGGWWQVGPQSYELYVTHELPLSHLPGVRRCARPRPTRGGRNPSLTHRTKSRQLKQPLSKSSVLSDP